MYRISQLASLSGLSRSTLLYYEKLGLIQSRRSSNGYRYFLEQDRQRLHLIQQLQAGGLTLKECKASIDAKLNAELLKQRLQSLDKEIEAKIAARTLLASLLGQEATSLSQWHSELQKTAPDVHHQWLLSQGFSEQQAHYVRWLSRDMNDHTEYMNDFMRIFSELECYGPGTDDLRLEALNSLPASPAKILDIGCGTGTGTLLLAEHTEAAITALDTDAPSLQRLERKAESLGYKERITTCCSTMQDIPLKEPGFDFIWCENSVYIMGFEKALNAWKSLLDDNGYMMVSDLVWVNDQPESEVKAFWSNEYPDMTTLDVRLKQLDDSGYSLEKQIPLTPEAWNEYASPLAERVQTLKSEMANSRAIADLEKELAIYDINQNLDHFNYIMMILKKR